MDNRRPEDSLSRTGAPPLKGFNCNGHGIDSVPGHAIFRHDNLTHG